MSGSPTYHYLPSFGRGRRNDYAGAIGGYIYARHRDGASLDEPFRLSPRDLARNYETDSESIRTALKRLCTETVRFKPLLEKTGRSEYRLTPEGVCIVENEKSQSFSVVDLVFGLTPRESAIKNTKAKYPAVAARWWGVKLRQWYNMKKRIQVTLEKADTGYTQQPDTGYTESGHRLHPRADTGCTQTQKEGCSILPEKNSLTPAYACGERPVSHETGKDEIRLSDDALSHLGAL